MAYFTPIHRNDSNTRLLFKSRHASEKENGEP